VRFWLRILEVEKDTAPQRKNRFGSQAALQANSSSMTVSGRKAVIRGDEFLPLF
jgi:hypothetical protein